MCHFKGVTFGVKSKKKKQKQFGAKRNLRNLVRLLFTNYCIMPCRPVVKHKKNNVLHLKKPNTAVESNNIGDRIWNSFQEPTA